jgi:hypothetical protein
MREFDGMAIREMAGRGPPRALLRHAVTRVRGSDVSSETEIERG